MPDTRGFAHLMLLERLDGGGESQVWRARDTRDGREVALKIVENGGAAAEVMASLRRQHELSRQVAHPSVLALDPPVSDGDRSGLPMPLAAGDARSLRGAAPARVLRVLREVSSAIAALHAQGIAHRDIKPGNVLLDAAGRAVIADFGCAARFGEDGGRTGHSPYSAGAEQRHGAAASAEDDLYGFGALAYELLSGYPPGFPGPVDPGTPVPTLSPRHPIPEALQTLVMSLLDPAAAGRPTGMAAVSEALRTIEPLPIAAAGARIRPLEDAEQEAIPTQGPTRSAWRGKVGVALAIAVSITALAGVFLWLPRLATEAPPVDLAATKPPAPLVGATPRPKPDPAAAARSMAEARAEFGAALEALEARAAGVWGGEDFAAAKAEGVSAAQAADQGLIDRSTALYRAARERLAVVSGRSTAALASQLAAGARALESGQTDLARQAFDIALQIEPQDAAARRGLERAARSAAVLPLLAEAESALLGERPLEAVTLYERVLREDPANPMAQAGLTRARGALGSDAYARAVGDALAALREGRSEAARAASARARALRPGGAELAALDAQLSALGSQRELGATRGSLAALESAERWSEAVAGYERLLAGDPTLEFARAGRARAAPRAELSTRLERLLTDPSRLSAPEIRREADALLARADAVRGPAPVLRDQSDRLRGSLQLYDRPVPAVLESDGMTTVSIQRVGAMGEFRRKELRLKPGRYVAIGSRPGFRDVRREFVVAPGVAPVVIEVRCTEAIS